MLTTRMRAEVACRSAAAEPTKLPQATVAAASRTIRVAPVRAPSLGEPPGTRYCLLRRPGREAHARLVAHASLVDPREADRVARRPCEEQRRERRRRRDLLAVDRGDRVAVAEPGACRRRAVEHARHEGAVRRRGIAEARVSEAH